MPLGWFSKIKADWIDLQNRYEPTHEVLALFVLCKFILLIRMPSHPVGLDVWFLVWPFVYFYSSCVWTVKVLADAWPFAGRLCDKYHNLMSWLIYTLPAFSCNWNSEIWFLMFGRKMSRCRQNQQDSDQPGHPPSLISLRCPHEETLGP